MADPVLAFAAILKNMGNIGFTYGGGCFFGHGVDKGTGSAKFVLTVLKLQ